MKVLDRFNSIAPVYDALKKFVFAGRADQAERVFVDRIPASAQVLIVGGGSGKILRDVFRAAPSCSVFYVEASSAMIARARKVVRKNSFNKVVFVHGTEASIPQTMQADVVITNFFLDVFHDSELKAIVATIRQHLKSDGLWLAADFADNARWQRGLLRVMYAFFRVTAGLSARSLPHWELALSNAGLVCLCEKKFYRGFIRVLLLRKVSE